MKRKRGTYDSWTDLPRLTLLRLFAGHSKR